MKLVEPVVNILAYTPNMEKVIERGIRVCYKSEDKITDESYSEIIPRIMNNKHFSTLEHASITVQIVTDRGVTHEAVRHRIASFSQESTRYCNYSKGKYDSEISVVTPFFFDPMEPRQQIPVPSAIKWNINSGTGNSGESIGGLANEMWIELNSFDVWYISCLWSQWGYNTLTQQFKRSAQEARSVLPNSLKTEIQITANVREWIHILSLRVHRDAHPQIRQVMIPILDAFAAKWPVLFGHIQCDNRLDDRNLAQVIWDIYGSQEV